MKDALLSLCCDDQAMARAVKSFDEQDVFTSWRRVYCWTRRAGACRRVKRRANRRERHEARAAIRAERA
jgi:hypothetical protein